MAERKTSKVRTALEVVAALGMTVALVLAFREGLRAEREREAAEAKAAQDAYVQRSMVDLGFCSERARELQLWDGCPDE